MAIMVSLALALDFILGFEIYPYGFPSLQGAIGRKGGRKLPPTLGRLPGGVREQSPPTGSYCLSLGPRGSQRLLGAPGVSWLLLVSLELQ